MSEKASIQEYFQIKANKIFVGSPSYVIKEDLLKSIWENRGSKDCFVISKGSVAALTASACGNKSYCDKHNHKYPTPMGALGVVNLKYNKADKDPNSRFGQTVVIPSGNALIDFSRDFEIFRIRIYDGVFSPANLVYDEILLPGARENIRVI